jgi:Hemerythrin HHE cation binding domain
VTLALSRGVMDRYLNQNRGCGVFDRLRKIFGGKQAPTSQALPNGVPTAEQKRAGGPIAYDAALVPALMQDHKMLVQLYGQVGEMATRGEYSQIPQMLMAFKVHLEGHLIAENVRFYNYVENSMQGDAENTALIRSFRREMNAIARGVVEFVKKYQVPQFDVQLRNEFMKDYATVGGLLAQRIEREEASLYPLYMPM